MIKSIITSGVYTFGDGGLYYRQGDRIFVMSKTTDLPAGFMPDLTQGFNIRKEDDYFYFDVKIVGWAKTIND